MFSGHIPAVWAQPEIDRWSAYRSTDYAKRILQFTNNFKNSSIGDICAASYGAFLTNAISIIDSACDDFVPPG